MSTSTNPAGGRHAVEHLDADAVCAQCGTVNPEETLICKVCGNNLRDQRQLRLAAEAQMEGETPGSGRRQFIRGALTVLGLLIVLWSALNVATITQWMIDAQVENVNPAEDLFFGATAGIFNDLTEELRANLPTPEESQEAMSTAAAITDYAGYYVIASRDGDIGSALLRPLAVTDSVEQVPTFEFVAILEFAEVRGVAQLRGNNLSADWNTTGIRWDGEYIPASGVVIQQQDGSFSGFAQTAITEEGFDFVAYKVAR